MEAKVVDLSGGGPYIFKVHGQICHRTSHIQSVNGQAPQYAQLYVIDSTQATEIRVEANNRNFIRTHQQQLRTEFYQGLADHLENAAQNAGFKAGIPVILPSSFEGSPRNMRECGRNIHLCQIRCTGYIHNVYG
ncbi:hypothetical protein AVEN_205465-1 [Araneus ventricosus]|uniref:Helitron helicase-like domain-containing protein n=1 Tax=Araneus ventricosus TaxID=182803 RepID=A0A4Y2CBJ1_ARAVE|nr:hypothetical protein AVEN_205465-1 [Araneus ventricosus]